MKKLSETGISERYLSDVGGYWCDW